MQINRPARTDVRLGWRVDSLSARHGAGAGFHEGAVDHNRVMVPDGITSCASAAPGLLVTAATNPSAWQKKGPSSGV